MFYGGAAVQLFFCPEPRVKPTVYTGFHPNCVPIAFTSNAEVFSTDGAGAAGASSSAPAAAEDSSDSDADDDESEAGDSPEKVPKSTVPCPQLRKDRRPKGAAKKQPREEATVEAAARNIPWLSKLLQGVQIQDDTCEATVSSDSYSNRSQAEKVLDSKPTPDSDLAAVAAELIADAFGPVSDPKFQDDLEGQEEQIEQDIGEESGISDMAQREGKLIQHACNEFAKLSETTAGKSALLEENLVAAIAQHVDMGMNPEEAAEEAMLNLDSVLGNESTSEAAHVWPRDGDDDAAIAAAAASRSRAMNSEAFRRWVEEVALSAQALQFKVSAQKRPVGEGGELSLVFGKIAEPKAGPAEGATEEEEEESQSVFWVHWKFAGELGRPATLDRDNRVKCIVATGKLRDARDYRSVEIIIPAVGVKMERVRGFKGQLRPQMPETSMRLHDMYQTAILAKDSSARCQQESLAPLEKYMASTAGADECFVCGSCHIKDVAQPRQRTPVADRVQTCPFCLLPSHFTCRNGLVEHAQTHEIVSFPPGVDIGSLDLPDHFDTDEPHLCRSQSSVAVTESDREDFRILIFR